MNSLLSKEINLEILFRNLDHALFCEILQKKFHLWSAVIGQSASVYKHRMNVDDVSFRKFISNVKVLTFERKIMKFLVRNRILK